MCEDKFEREMWENFPLLYKEKPFIGVGPGWNNIIYELSIVLEGLCIKYLIQNPDAPKPTISQIKSKFGTLRFYMDNNTEEMYREITKAEMKSYNVCELCGADGQIRPGGWVMTLCDKCHKDNSEQI